MSGRSGGGGPRTARPGRVSTGARIRRLPLPLREVAALRLEGLADAEIASVAGISVGNVAVRLTRARQALRELIGGPRP